MRTLYLDCGMGAAGDMLTAALLELLPDREAFLSELNRLDLPGVEFLAEPAVKCGITGTHIRVLVHGQEEGQDGTHSHNHSHAHTNEHEHVHEHTHEHEHVHTHEYEHEHEHVHEHSHHHSGMHDIEHIVQDHLALPQHVKADILAVYGLIAQAESHAHGVPVSEIHFHEVGTMDAIADVTAVCLLMDRLRPDQVVVSPVHVGSGTVRCAHGTLPVPAPATAHILQGIPIYGGSISGELCTPTGAALLKHFATRFGDMPVMQVSAIGYGMGMKDFETANCVRAMLGESAAPAKELLELSCNLDDMTGEQVGFAMDRLLEAGALDVYTIPIGMKKSRPGIMLRVICREADRESLLRLLFLHTTTLGIRETAFRRYELARTIETVETPSGPVRVKRADGYGVRRSKPEYDDLAALSWKTGMSLAELAAMTELST